MNSRRILSRIDPAEADTSSWRQVDAMSLAEGKPRDRFLRRRAAILDYLAGRPLKAIKRTHGIGPINLWKMRERCLAAHPEGGIWGFHALVPGTHVKIYARKPSCPLTRARGATPAGRRGGHSGQLGALFARHPEIWETIEELFLKRQSRAEPGRVHETRIAVKDLHTKFLRLCTDKGITPDQYPFTCRWVGYGSLAKRLRALFNANPTEATNARHGAEAARLLGPSLPGHSPTVIPRLLRPFHRVALDAHRIDMVITVEITMSTGAKVTKTLERLWLLVVQDVASRAVLGYHLVLNPECSADDVLRCFHNALTPWQPPVLTIKDLAYRTDGGLPSAVIPECARGVWDETLVDNALAHLADRVRETVTEKLGSAFNAGPVRCPKRRALIERLFKTFATHCHRLPNTTGSGPGDPRRRNPARAAVHYRATAEELEQFVAVVLSDYNGEPHDGLFHTTPLQYIRSRLAMGDLFRTLDAPAAGNPAAALVSRRYVCTVRGDVSKGRRPHVNLEGAPYSSHTLGELPGLIGKKIFVELPIADPSVVSAALPDGRSLGLLNVQGKWRGVPHDLSIRREFNRLYTRKLLRAAEGVSPTEALLAHYGRQAKTSKRAASAYQRVVRAMAEASARTPVPPPAVNTGPSTTSHPALATAPSPRAPAPLTGVVAGLKLPRIIRG